MSHSLERLTARVAGTPLLITQRKLDMILNVLAPRMGINPPDVSASAYRNEPSAREYEVTGGVAIVPVIGTLLHRCDGIDAESGLTSYAAIGDMVRSAVDDPHVHHVVLDIDSSGGEAQGVFDQVDRIFGMRGTKPITAVVNEEANSAAYAIASAADRVVMTRTAIAGSIGVIATHIDQSQHNEQEGLRVTHVYAGERKADYSPHQPLSDEAEQRLQEQVNSMYDVFVETVARNRGISERAVRETRAAFFIGQAAVNNGLADGVESMESVIRRAQERGSNMSSRSAAAKGGKKTQASGGSCPAQAGENLGNELERLINDQATEDRTSQDIQDEMAEEAGIDPSTVDSIINGSINCPPRERLEGFAEVLGTTVDDLIEAAEQDGCDYSGDGSADAAGQSAETVSRSDAAAIVDACAEAGVPSMASGLIKEGLSAKDAKARIQSAGKIRDICTAAGFPESEANGFIQAGKSPSQVKSELFDRMVSQQSDEISPHVGPAGESTQTAAKDWGDVYGNV